MPEPDSDLASTPTGLLLTGGGARAAYQVGVLEALADLRRASGVADDPNPFPIICGTSAGALNAAALACGADRFDATVRDIVKVWRDIHADQVYRSDFFSMLRSGAGLLGVLLMGWLVARWRHKTPRSLLNNAPLEDLLRRIVPLERLPDLIRDGHVQALAVTASSYTSGEHFTFFEGDERLAPWVRTQRRAVRDRISYTHLLASSAIPFMFPAAPLPIEGHVEYFGDGSMRQSAPVAPAIHLGARRILVVGAGRMHEPRRGLPTQAEPQYPSLAQIAGHTLSNIFLDALAVDIERVRRINKTISLVPEHARAASALQPIDLLVIAPSQRLDAIAARHVGDLPPAVRTMLGGVGVSSDQKDIKGAALASYLLFEPSYTHELMRLGYADAQNQAHEVCRFFGWPQDHLPAPTASHLPTGIERRRDPFR